MPAKLNRQSLLPVLMMLIGGVLLFGSFVWFEHTSEATASDAPSLSAENAPYPQIKRVSLADAKAAYDLGSAVFLDVRGDPYFLQGHVPGAISIAGDELAERLDELDRTMWIITYCT
ncbi:MAG: hypothetical protein JXA78_11455 [Anaerolineales bacterium]|nr:hypothetical protein [Anaerolineales bacterium]